MKAQLALISALTFLASTSRAGLFEPRNLHIGKPSAYFSSAEYLEQTRSYIPEVPVKGDCQPKFVAGDDGIFRRTDYCHPVNPTAPRDFLKQGFDVPASFLIGFTEADTVSRWTEVKLQPPTSIYTPELPVAMLNSLSTTAAKTWDLLFACAKGDADRAREIYRLGVPGCDVETVDKSIIRSRISDLRTSLKTLAASDDVAQLELNVAPRLQIVRITGGRQYNPSLIQILEGHKQRLPRIHPLLTQIIFEELLSLVDPEQSAWSAARPFKKKPELKNYLTFLLVWARASQDFGCSALGLWPSANRTAIEAFGDKVVELWSDLGGEELTSLRPFDLVLCPAPEGLRPIPPSKGGNVPFAYFVNDTYFNKNNENLMRLNDIYTEGRLNAWRELRDVRERHLTPIK